MNVMPIGGKSPNETLAGIAVDANGNLLTKRVWKSEVTQIYSESTPTSGTKACTEVDLSDVGAVSLRVTNSTDKQITLGLYADYISNSYHMRDAKGNLSRYVIPANTSQIMITPDDWPQLQWLKKLRLIALVPEDTTTGTLAIYAVTKG